MTNFNKLSLCLLLFISNFTLAQKDFRTATAAVSWNNASNWQIWDGSKWVAASNAPDSLDNVFIQSGHTVSLSSNHHCKTLYISSGTNTSLSGDGLLALQTYTLSIHNRLSCYYGTVNTTINSTAILAYNDTTVTPSLPISKSSGGLVKFVGNSRIITSSTEWGGNASGSNSLFDIEFALNAGDTGIFSTIVKAANWVISSGTLKTDFRIAVDNNTSGQGNFTLASSAELISSESGSSTPVISRTATTRCGTVTINGTIKLSGLSPFIEASTINLGSNAVIEYSRAGNQNFINASASGAVNLTQYKHVVCSGSGTKTTLPGIATSIIASGSLTLAGGNFAVGGSGGSFSVSSSQTTLIYAGTSSQNASTSEWLSNFQNLIISNPAGVTLSFARSINGTITLAQGTFTHSGNLTLGNGATIIRSGGSIASAPNFGSVANVNYEETNQAINSGPEIPTSASVLYNLTINNRLGINLTNSLTVNHSLLLVNGNIISTASNTIILDTACQVTGASDSSLVSGPCIKKLNDTLSFTFPIGKGSTFRPVIISPNQSNLTTFTIEYFNSPFSDTTNLTAPITRVSKHEYFVIARGTSGSPSNALIALSWGAESGVNNSHISELTLARYSASNRWVNQAGTGSGNAYSGFVTSNTAVSVFGTFSIANANSNNNSLPVNLLFFKGNLNDKYVELNWETASEINCYGYEIQISKDNINYISHLFIPSKTVNGNSISRSNYTVSLEYNGYPYFRLNQIDMDQKLHVLGHLYLNHLESINWRIAHKKLFIKPLNSMSLVVSIFDTQMKRIKRFDCWNEESIELDFLPMGTYFLTINNQKPVRFMIIE